MANFSLVPGGRGTNYTGMLTRSIVFSGALFVFLGATAMTLAAIIIPDWISYDSYTAHHRRIQYTYGLSKRCSNTAITPDIGIAALGTSLHCVEFPRYPDCSGAHRYFCSMWRSVGFLMSFGVVIEGMTIAAFLILLAGGKQKREQGWPVMAMLTGGAALVQAVAMSLTAYLFENDDRFLGHGWFLDRSWIICTVSWVVQVGVAVAISLAAICLPSEGGYELIPDRFEEDDA